jgi:hypothetical protein
VLLVGAAFAIPVITLRLMYRASLSEWAWWDSIRVNVPFLLPEPPMIIRAFRNNAKVLLFYNVGWWLAVRAVRRLRDPFTTDAAFTLAVYVVLAYFVVYIRELRHFLPLAILLLPLAVSEYAHAAEDRQPDVRLSTSGFDNHAAGPARGRPRRP